MNKTIVFLMMLAAGAWALTTISSCGNLTVANEMYVLNQSVSPASGNCINVQANGVVLDCAGYSIIGTNNSLGTGINITRNDATVKNCIVGGFSKGVFLYSANRTRLDNVSAYNNTYGIHAYRYVVNNTLANVDASNNTQYGIYLQMGTSVNSSLYNVTANYNGNSGVYIYQAANNTLSNVTANNNSQYGVYLYGTSYNRLYNMTTNSNYWAGIYVYWSTAKYNVIMNATANDNWFYGIDIYSTSHNVVSGARTRGNRDGIRITSLNNTLSNVAAWNNSEAGVFYYLATNSTGYNINASNNSQFGILFRGGTNTNVSNNMACDNAIAGYVFDSGYTYGATAYYGSNNSGIRNGFAVPQNLAFNADARCPVHPCYCASCGECTMMLKNDACDVTYVTADISNTNYCIDQYWTLGYSYGNNNFPKTLDCQGHRLSGNTYSVYVVDNNTGIANCNIAMSGYSTTGVYLGSSYSMYNISVRNVTFHNMSVGVQAGSVFNLTVDGISAVNVSNNLVFLTGARNSTIRNFEMRDTITFGLQASNFSNSTVSNITSYNSRLPVYLLSGTGNRITGISGYNDSWGEVYLAYSDASGNYVSGIYSNGSAKAASISGSNNTVANVYAYGDGMDVISVNGANNTIANVTMVNVGRGIMISGYPGTTIDNATFIGGNGYGAIYLAWTNNTRISNFNSYNDSGTGEAVIYVYHVSNSSFSNITVDSCAMRGIYLSGSTNNAFYNVSVNDSGNYYSYPGVTIYGSSDNLWNGGSVAYGSNGFEFSGNSSNNTLYGLDIGGNSGYAMYFSDGGANNISQTSACTSYQGYYFAANSSGNYGDGNLGRIAGSGNNAMLSSAPCPASMCGCSSCAVCSADLLDQGCAGARLSTSISSNGTCISVTGATGGILDCNGYSIISGNGNGSGAYFSAPANVNVVNCTAAGFEYGFYIDGGENNTLSDNNATNSSNSGFIFANNSTGNLGSGNLGNITDTGNNTGFGAIVVSQGGTPITVFRIKIANKLPARVYLMSIKMDGLQINFTPAVRFAPASARIVEFNTTGSMCSFRGETLQFKDVEFRYMQGMIQGLSQTNSVPLLIRCS